MSPIVKKDLERYKPRHAWYLADALVLVRELQARVWPLGYHVALGGGVLNHGYSDKDVDLYVLPLGKTLSKDPDYVVLELNDYFGIIGTSYDGDAESVQEFERVHGAGSWDQNTWFAHSLNYKTRQHTSVDVFVVQQ
jgi:acetamidase/formamidase